MCVTYLVAALKAQRRHGGSRVEGHLPFRINQITIHLTMSHIRVRNRKPSLSAMVRIVALPALWTNCLCNKRYEVIDAVDAARLIIGIAFQRPRQMGVNVLAPKKVSRRLLNIQEDAKENSKSNARKSPC